MTQLVHKPARTWEGEAPKDWSEVEPLGRARRFKHLDGLAAIPDWELHDDGHWWLHISLSRRPGFRVTFQDMRRAKNAFAGKSATGVQVFPPEDQFFDLGGGLDVYHVWCREEPFLPDFRRPGGL